MRKELELLEKVVEILDKHNIHFWMYGGALASYIKINDLFPWDNDIDLFIWKKDYKKLMKIKKEFNTKYIIKEYTLALCGNNGSFNVDIMFFEKNGNKASFDRLVTKNKLGRIFYFGVLSKVIDKNMWHTANFFKWLIPRLNGASVIRQEVPLHFFKDLKEINLFGVKLKVPKDHEGFMDYSYGKYWRLPIEEQEKEYDREGKCHPDYYQIIKR